MTEWPMRAMPGSGCRASPLSGLATLLALALGVSACDVPTAAPEWDTRWIVPAEETTVEVDEFLPDDVTLAAGGSAFSVQVDPVNFTESLGDLCPTCPSGGSVISPGFVGTFEETASLPSDVTSATVSQGSISVAALNGFGFDPIRVGGSTGTITITLYDGTTGGSVLDQVLVDGATESFAPGSTLNKTLSIASATVGNTLTVEMSVNSPSGGPISANTSQTLQITATPGEILVSSATVNVANQDVSFDPTDLDVEDIDQEVVDHIRSGAFEFDITNPLGIAVAFTITISGDGFSDIVKTLNITGAATQTGLRIEFSQAELQSFMGKTNVTLSGDGTVSGSAGTITVSPGQAITIDSRLDIVLIIGGGD